MAEPLLAQALLTGTGMPNVPISWLAFFFVFAAVYGILTTAGPGKGGLFQSNSVNVIIAVVFAFAAAGSSSFLAFFRNNFLLLVWIFIGLFVLAFLLEVFGLRGMEAKQKAKEHSNLTIVFGGLVLLVMATFGFGLLQGIDVPVIGTRNAMAILGLLFILQMFYYAYHGGGE